MVGSAGKPGFIFDCDGTFMDTIEAWHRAEDSLMKSAGISLTKAQRDELNSLTLEEAGQFFYDRFDVLESPKQVTAMIEDHLLDYYRHEAELKSGARRFLDEILDRGYPVAVLSSSPQIFLQAGLGRVGVLPLFDAVVSVDDIPTTKRHQETYINLCKALGCNPAKTWFFDDSWYALKTASEAGLHTIGIFSSDNCGTHEELAQYSERVEDDFLSVRLGDFGL